jgi:hypothetical protein
MRQRRKLFVALRAILLLLCALTVLVAWAYLTPRTHGGSSRLLPIREWGFGQENFYLWAGPPKDLTKLGPPALIYRRYGFIEVCIPTTEESHCE